MNKVTDILSFINKHDVKYIKVSIIDILGGKKSVELPLSCLDDVRKNQVKCDSSSILGGRKVNDSDMSIIIDESSASLASDKTLEIYGSLAENDGTFYELDSRYSLIKQMKVLQRRGYVLNVGLEPEFYLIDKESLEPIDNLSYFSLEEDDISAKVRREAATLLLNEGYVVGPYHHEVGPGQCEINFSYADALNSSDRLFRYKEIIKSVAKRLNCIATFLPKPFLDLPGSGMHLNCSLSNLDGKNVVGDKDNIISPVAKQFIDGILFHSKALTAFSCTISNSYLRLHSSFEAPGKIYSSFNDRTAAIRIPYTSTIEKRRFELRFVDNSANLYLLLSAIIASGLDGLDHPGRKYDETKLNEELPHTLKESLFELEADEVIKNALGKELIDTYSKIKAEEDYNYPLNVLMKTM